MNWTAASPPKVVGSLPEVPTRSRCQSTAVAILVKGPRLCRFFVPFRGPQDTCFEGGVFPAVLTFPSDYPLSPPKMRFTCDMFHPNSRCSACNTWRQTDVKKSFLPKKRRIWPKKSPQKSLINVPLKNERDEGDDLGVFPSPPVYPDGRVCISILHAPGDDPMGYESSAERWSPVQSVEKILLSVVSMLAGSRSSPFARHRH